MSVYATASKNRTLVFTGGTLQTGFASVEALEQERDERIAADNAEAAARIAGDLANAGFDDLPQLLADNSTLQVGSIVLTKKEQFSFEVVSSDPHLTTSGGSMLRAVGTVIDPVQCGAVGDGVADDTDALNAASAALSGGGTLVLRNTYLITQPIVINSNTIVEGYTTGTIRRGFNTHVNGRMLVTCPPGTDGVVFSGLTFDDAGDVFTDSHNIFFAEQVTNIGFKDCTFLSVVDFHAIDVASISGLRVERCRFLGYANKSGTSPQREAIQLDSDVDSTGLGAAIADVVVSDCYFGANPDNVDPDFGAWPVAVGNHFANLAGSSTTGIRITGNRIVGATFAGVRCYSWRDVTISNNTFHQCEFGVQLDRGSGGYPFGCKNISITGNTFTSCGPCVYLLNNNFLEHDDLHESISVSGNVARNCAAMCRLYGVDKISITGNTLIGTGASAFVLAPNDRNNIVGSLTVTGNTSENTTNFIFLALSSTEVVVVGNNVKNLSSRFAHVLSALRVTINDNMVVDCAGPNYIEVNSSNNCLISDNNFGLGVLSTQPSGAELIRSTASGRVHVQGNLIGTGITTTPAFVNNGNFFSGVVNGDPEGVITAGIGSRVTRRDGGAGATFYVKESGTGNTGWVAK